MKLLLAWPQLNEAHVETIQQETGAVLLRPADKDELPELVEHAEVSWVYQARTPHPGGSLPMDADTVRRR